MSIALQGVFEAKAREFNLPANSERFQYDFIRAVNRALGELNTLFPPESDIDAIDAVDDTVADLDADDEWILSAGISWHLSLITIGTERMDKALLRAEWDRAKGAYQAKLVTALIDDGDEDVVGLGYQE